LDGVAPVAATLLPLGQALGRVAAEMPAVVSAQPEQDVAAFDGWACRALDLVGASAYSPVALPTVPAWIETGDAMPKGCDCVLQADLVECHGPIAQAVGEAVPGQGVRRAGEDMAAGRPALLEGRTLSALDLLVARKAGLDELAVRIPRVRVVDVASGGRATLSRLLVTERLRAAAANLAAL